MSDTFGIGCKKCKKYVWIGQGWNKDDFFIYTGAKNTMNLLKNFLWSHKGHDLIFEDTCDENSLLDYKEIE